VIHKAQICQEIGREQEVQVFYNEGLANYIDPEPCQGLRIDGRGKGVMQSACLAMP
jgi:hypothetical protein